MQRAIVVVVKLHAVKSIFRIEEGAFYAIHVVTQLEQFVRHFANLVALVSAENLAVDVVDGFFV